MNDKYIKNIINTKVPLVWKLSVTRSRNMQFVVIFTTCNEKVTGPNVRLLQLILCRIVTKYLLLYWNANVTRYKAPLLVSEWMQCHDMSNFLSWCIYIPSFQPQNIGQKVLDWWEVPHQNFCCCILCSKSSSKKRKVPLTFLPSTHSSKKLIKKKTPQGCDPARVQCEGP